MSLDFFPDDRSRSVTSNDNHFDILSQEKVDQLPSIFTNLLSRTGAIGRPRRISNIDDFFMGKLAHELAHNGQAPDTRIQKTNWSIIHTVFFLVFFLIDRSL
ncbi:Uncharacterised protein [Streptococcus pneumoniae]|nr:Uncharacterised protein [Streptococcus pneumoniae]